MLADRRLSQPARATLSSSSATILVSAVSGFEIAIKFKSGKLVVPERLAFHLAEVVADNGWHSLALTIEHAQLAGRLDTPHRDPFDRMLAAQSLIEQVPLVTNDAAFAQFGVQMVW